jgi:hypothetical protein
LKSLGKAIPAGFLSLQLIHNPLDIWEFVALIALLYLIYTTARSVPELIKPEV